MTQLDAAMASADLASLQYYLETLSVQTTLLPQSEQIALETLLVNLRDEPAERDRWLALNFAPQAADDFEQLRLLQLYVALPFTYLDACHADLLALLNAINALTIVGGFLLNQDERTVLFRHIYVTAQERPLETALIAELISLIHFTLDLFASAVEPLAAGRMSLEQALAQLQLTLPSSPRLRE